MKRKTNLKSILLTKALFCFCSCFISPNLIAQELTVKPDTTKIKNDLPLMNQPIGTNYEIESFEYESDRTEWSFDTTSVSFKYIPQPVYPDIFQQRQAPIHRNEFNVSGPVYIFENGILYGAGSQENLPGIGQKNSAAFMYLHSFNDRLNMNLELRTNKLTAPPIFRQSIGSSARVTYQLLDNLYLHVFGSYTVMPGYNFQSYNFGASVSYDFTDRWGLEMGANRYYDPYSRRWDINPVVIPYFRINKDTRIGIDFGPIIKEQFLRLNRGNKSKNPTIGPPVMR